MDDQHSRSLATPAALSPELLLSAIVDSSDDAIVSKNLDGVITSWNRAAERIFGYSADESVGKPVTMLIPPDRQSEETQILARLKRGERIDHFETIRVRKDGTRLHVSLTISPIKSPSGVIIGASKIARDITKQKGLELALSKSEALSSSILNSTVDCIKVLDLEGRLISMNPPGLAVLDLADFESVRGKRWQALWPEQMQPLVRQAIEEARAGRTARFQGPCATVAGVKKWWDVIVTPLHTPNEALTRLTATSRDITELKHAEEAMKAACAEAERQSRMKDEFLATLSHELRTPLQSILGWAQILRSDDHTPEDLTQGLETIDRNASAQRRIIEDLLDLNRILSGKVRLDVQKVNLGQILEQALETVKPAAQAKGIRLQPIIDPLVRPGAGDPNRLQQVFWNLLSNAIKFTPRAGRVQVRLERVNSQLEVTVADNGEGIDPSFLPYVFDRFRQADATTTRRQGGLGLGLAIVKHLVELHGGAVRVHSEGLGQGATFSVTLPVAAVHVEPGEDVRRPADGPDDSECSLPLPRINDVSVLVVDDEVDARLLLARILIKAGATVHTAGSAAEALEQLRQHQPDILISDIGMPRTDGYGLVRAVRAMPAAEGGHIPAIALTAYTRTEDRVKAIAEGFQMHISKPCDAVELLTIVASLTGRVN